MKTVELRDGSAMPALGLGTWKSAPGEVGAAVETAVRLGYRHIDCAAIYGNEAEVGAALAACFERGDVTREELWVTSKLWNDRHARADVAPALKRTLGDLGLEYLDLYLVHWPVAHRKGVLAPGDARDFIALADLPLSETWAGMEDAVDAGLCRHVGVSNFSAKKIAALTDGARIAPEALQVEMHPYLQQQELLDFCRERHVAVTAYSPLGSPDRPDSMKGASEPVLLEDPVIRGIANRRGATPAQVLIAWAVQRGTSVIPKSVNAGRIEQNLQALEVELTEDDMREIAGLEQARRYVTGEFWVREGGPYTLTNLWDEAVTP